MIIERYILRNYIGPFFFALSVITFVFIMDFIVRYIDLFLGKGVPFHVVMQAFILSLGHMFALIIPMSVLPATLMAFGNLASENEITAMKATGVSVYRMILPGAVAAVLLSVALVYYNNEILPESNHRLLNLIIDIQQKQPTVELEPNTFIDDLEGYTIYFREKDDRTGEIRDVQVFKRKRRGIHPATIVAESGHLKFIKEYGVLKIDLRNGEMHELPVARDRSRYRRTRFREYTMHIKDVDRSLQRSKRTHRGDREMSVSMMRERIEEIKSDIALADVKIVDVANRRVRKTFKVLDLDHREELHKDARADSSALAAARRNPGGPKLRQRGQRVESPQADNRNEFVTRQEIETQVNRKTSYDKQINRYRVEIHKKYSIPFACLIFVLVGAPLAIRMGKAGMGMAVGLSILFFLVYYVCLIGGEKVADRGIINPAAAMWAPNVIFGVMSIILLRSAAKEQSVFGWTLVSAIKTIFRRNAAPNPR